jgi:hypothetical protein
MNDPRRHKLQASKFSAAGFFDTATVSILAFIVIVSLGDLLVNYVFNGSWDLQLIAQVIYVAAISIALILSTLSQRKNLSLILSLLLVAGFVVYLLTFSSFRGEYLYHLSKLVDLPGALTANPNWLGTLFSNLETIAPTFIPIVFIFVVMKRLSLKQRRF